MIKIFLAISSQRLKGHLQILEALFILKRFDWPLYDVFKRHLRYQATSDQNVRHTLLDH